MRNLKGTPIAGGATELCAMNTNDALLNEAEAAGLLKLALPTLSNWRVARRGPAFVKLGRRSVRYRLGDLQAFIAAGEQATQPAGRPGGAA